MKNQDDLKKISNALSDLKAVAESARDLFAPFDDLDALHTFQTRKAAEYFHQAAKKASTPAVAAEKNAVADMLEKSIAVMKRLDQSDVEPTPEEETFFARMEEWGGKLESSGEMKLVEDYQASKISEFVEAHPDIWRRLAQTDNKFVAKAKEYLKPGQ